MSRGGGDNFQEIEKLASILQYCWSVSSTRSSFIQGLLGPIVYTRLRRANDESNYVFYALPDSWMAFLAILGR